MVRGTEDSTGSNECGKSETSVWGKVLLRNREFVNGVKGTESMDLIEENEE